jgi:hypothetical protein
MFKSLSSLGILPSGEHQRRGTNLARDSFEWCDADHIAHAFFYEDGENDLGKVRGRIEERFGQ